MTVSMTFGDMSKALNRAPVYLTGLQRRFALPVYEGPSYTPAYFSFLRKLVFLRALAVSEDLLADLWSIEKHLLQLLHFDTCGSPTWFLDECAQSGHLDRRLLLTHRDMGPEFTRRMVQPQLDFDPASSGLFSQREVGDDVMQMLARYHKRLGDVLRIARAEAPLLRASLHWLPRLNATEGSQPRSHRASPR